MQLETEIPRIARDVAIEMLSPKDRRDNVAENVRVYLATGSLLAVLVDPDSQTVDIVEAKRSRRLGPDDSLPRPK